MMSSTHPASAEAGVRTDISPLFGDIRVTSNDGLTAPFFPGGSSSAPSQPAVSYGDHPCHGLRALIDKNGQT